MAKVIVHIWRPFALDEEGKAQIRSVWATAAKEVLEDHGIGSEAQHTLVQSVGHAATEIIYDDGKSDYISYWPRNPNLNSRTSLLNAQDPGHFQIKKVDFAVEGKGSNYVAIELESLDIDAIRASTLFKAYQNASSNPPGSRAFGMWTARLHLGTPANSFDQNCCTTTWNLLTAGGIRKLQPQRYGPDDPELRQQYKCDEGQIASGFFDNFFWRDWIVSTTLILHLSASAKEHEIKPLQLDVAPSSSSFCNLF